MYFGAPEGVHPVADSVLSAPLDASFGSPYGIASAGDVNGDGYGDVLVGAFDADAGKGLAHVFLGGPGGLSTSPAIPLSPSEPKGQFGRSG